MRHLALASLLCVACAKSAPPPKAPAPPPPAPEPERPPTTEHHDDGLAISGTLGSLSDQDIAEAFRARWPDVAKCSKAAQLHRGWITGTVELKMRVGQTGPPLKAYVERSTLGNYEAERCILEIARGLTFPAPHGGAEAEFLFPIEVRAREGGSLIAWEEAKVAPTLDQGRVDIGYCRGETITLPHKGPHRPRKHAIAQKPMPKVRLPAGAALTLYILPGGKVASAGLAADGPIDDGFATCLIGKTKTWKLDDPRGRVAKTTIGLVP